MSDIDIEVGSLEYSGPMNTISVIKAVEGWFKANDYKFIETKRKHKSDEIELKLEANKKIHEYVKVEATVEMKFMGLEDIEMIRHGQKTKMQDGYADITISGVVKLDPYKRFKGSEFLQKLGDFMNSKLLKKDIHGVWKNAHYYELLKLHRVIKEVLEFETPVSAK